MKRSIISSNPQIILAGGGHGHVVALRLLGLQPIEGARVTLVSDVAYAICASMLPGIVAGKYRLEEAMIDLRKLCEFAGVEFVQGSVSGINLNEKFLALDRGTTLSFRVLSLNLGSRPAFSEEESVKEHTWPLKPVEIFLAKLETFVAKHQEGDSKTFVVVGGGKSGFEMACALSERLHSDVIIHIIQANTRFLEDYRERTSDLAFQALEKKNVVIHLDEYVTEVTPNSVLCESGLEVPADVILWASHPEPAVKWLRASGLAVDQQGFLQIRKTLQSASHTYIFALGEIASMQGCNYPRTANLGIRQGALLYENLKRWIEGSKLDTFDCHRGMCDFIFSGYSTAILQSKMFSVNSRLASRFQGYLEKRFVAKHSCNRSRE